MKRTVIAVSWVSFNHDPFERNKDGSYRGDDGRRNPGPALEFLFNLGSPVGGRVKRFYLLGRRSSPEGGKGRAVHPREVDVIQELKEEIEKRPSAPEVKVLWWDSDAAPTDHRALIPFTSSKLVEIRRAHPKAQIAVNISPGTPAMQTVMLMALQARVAGDRVRAFQGIPQARRRDEKEVMREVPWNLLAELAATQTETYEPVEEKVGWNLAGARSKALRRVATLVERYSGVPFPVLILGARGTGKTSIAKSLRSGYCRAHVKAETEWDFHLNCAEFRGDPTMLRSALFGHEKGAFTGADKTKPGLLERAAEDCVFLDEIHWLDSQAQGQLLLALQRNGTIRRIASEKSIPVRCRMLVATNQEWGDLRESLTPDFLDRVSDLVIELPELRDCREDLGDIWGSVVRNACEELISRDASRAITGKTGAGNLEALVAEFHPHRVQIERAIRGMRLPGNFRDLEKLAIRLLVAGLREGRFLSLSKQMVREELARLIRDEGSEGVRGGEGDRLLEELPSPNRCAEHLREVRDAGSSFAGEAAVNEWEKRLLLAALKVGGSGAKAAALLGMKARTLTAKLKKLREAHEERGRSLGH